MPAVEGLQACLRTSVGALLFLAAIFVAARRWCGALEAPLEIVPLLSAAVVLVALAQLARAAAYGSPPPARNALVSMSVIVIAASFTLPGASSFGLATLWALILGGELWGWRRILSTARSTGRNRPCPPKDAARSDESSIAITEPKEPAADVLQQLTLRATVSGEHELSGWLRVPLSLGQRAGNLHVAFVPSFARTPRVQFEEVSGPACRIKAAQVLPYGVRLDFKLDEPARPGESVLVWFYACD